MRILTAGESHGKGLFAIVEGLPKGLEIDVEKIDAELFRRSGGYGRGPRQQMENDRVEILSGTLGGKTTASPIVLEIRNKDYENWERVFCGKERKPISRPRPGHADLAGMIKYETQDARAISERASARNTAIKVAVGALCRQYLDQLGVRVTGFVRSIGAVSVSGDYAFEEIAERRGSLLGMPDPSAEERARRLIEEAGERGDSLGGILELRAKGLKAGFGSCMQEEEKLDARIAFAFFCVQAIKGVEFGLGFRAAETWGSKAQDEIFLRQNRLVRGSNRAGGVEGGMSNGEEIVIRAAMKPIPTIKRGLKSVDLETGEPAVGAFERADVCAVTACEVVLEGVLCTEILKAVLTRLGGDTIAQLKERYERLR